MDQKPPTKTNIDLPSFSNDRRENISTVLCGTNNCGKSYLLREINRNLGKNAYYLACQRFYNIQQFNSRLKADNEEQQFYNNFVNMFQSNQNFDQGSADLQTLLTGLNQQQLDLVLKLCSELIGNEFKLLQIRENHPFSPFYISVNGYNMSYSSSGSRLLMMILAVMANDDFNTVLLDEPEIGLTPSLQTKLANYIFDIKKRNEVFPHLKQIYIATHSHLFLDRKNIQNNFSISKVDEMINIEQIQTFNDFHNLQFNLLGNTFESLFLPSIVLILEGKTDAKYLMKVTKMLFPNTNISYLQANTDSEIVPNLNKIDSFLNGLSKSPYRDRIFVVLDSTHSPTIMTGLINKGVKSDNIIEWSKNGIEFYYPKEIIEDIFSCNYSDFECIDLTGTDRITVNGITKTKNELCEEVISKIGVSPSYNNEFKEKFLNKLISKIG